MTTDAERYLEQFALMLRGDFNTLPIRLPPDVRREMEYALQRDEWIRGMDAKQIAAAEKVL